MNQPPTRIFKYFRLNEYSLSALSRSELFLNHFEAFNDPFECWARRFTRPPHPTRERDRFMAVSSAFGFPEEPGIETETYGLLCEELEGGEIPITNTLSDARISCFSERSDNLLMWAHYADGMRGFCVEFDTRVLNEGIADASILAVAYRDEPPTFDSFLWSVAANQADWHREQLASGEDRGMAADYQAVADSSESLLRDLYQNLLATKPREWEYEQEVRLIVHGLKDEHRKGVRVSFPPDAVKALYIGDRVSLRDKSRILATRKNAVKAWAATRRLDSYGINHALLWDPDPT